MSPLRDRLRAPFRSNNGSRWIAIVATTFAAFFGALASVAAWLRLDSHPLIVRLLASGGAFPLMFAIVWIVVAGSFVYQGPIPFLSDRRDSPRLWRNDRFASRKRRRRRG
jgi:hypothetical protein